MFGECAAMLQRATEATASGSAEETAKAVEPSSAVAVGFVLRGVELEGRGATRMVKVMGLRRCLVCQVCNGPRRRAHNFAGPRREPMLWVSRDLVVG